MDYSLKTHRSLHRLGLYRIDNIGHRLNIGQFQELALFKIFSDQKELIFHAGRESDYQRLRRPIYAAVWCVFGFPGLPKLVFRPR